MSRNGTRGTRGRMVEEIKQEPEEHRIQGLAPVAVAG